MENGIRKESLEYFLEICPEQELVAEVNVEEEAIHSAELSVLREHLRKLDEQDQIFLAQCFSGIPERKLAETLGITREALRWRRDKLIQKLRELFGISTE